MGEHVSDMATSTAEGIKAAPGKVSQKAMSFSTPIVQSAADRAQPYVHRTIGIVTPYVESTLTSGRLQALYQSRMVQATIEKATPYVAPIVKNSKIHEVVQPVVDWARPRAHTD